MSLPLVSTMCWKEAAEDRVQTPWSRKISPVTPVKMATPERKLLSVGILSSE